MGTTEVVLVFTGGLMFQVEKKERNNWNLVVRYDDWWRGKNFMGEGN